MLSSSKSPSETLDNSSDQETIGADFSASPVNVKPKPTSSREESSISKDNISRENSPESIMREP